MFGMGHWEILIIVLIVLLVFGAKRIPEMAQGLGRGIKEFRKAMHDVQEEIDVSAPPPATANKIEPSTPQQSVNRGADTDPGATRSVGGATDSVSGESEKTQS